MGQVAIVSCSSDTGDGKTIVINTTTDGQADGGTVSLDRQTATVDICSTKITC